MGTPVIYLKFASIESKGRTSLKFIESHKIMRKEHVLEQFSAYFLSPGTCLDYICESQRKNMSIWSKTRR